MMAWRHGYSGYIHHACRCEVCKDAQRKYMRRMRAEHPELEQSNRLYGAARGRAFVRLAARHPDEMSALLAEELGRAPLSPGRKVQAN